MANNILKTQFEKKNQLFSDKIPKLYDFYAVPIYFEDYADNIADRLISYTPSKILEIAAGTGVVTRRLLSKLKFQTQITATDLSEDMIKYASTLVYSSNVVWKQADAMNLPFEDAAFDAVVCQFGVMFFPDKIKAYSEIHRVLKKGGVFIFNVWDRLEENEFTYIANNSMKEVFPDNPPTFFERIPFGYYDREAIGNDIINSAFRTAPKIVTVEKSSVAYSPMDVAISLCEGTPLRNDIIARDSSKLEYSKEVAAKAIEKHFGMKKLEGKMKAHVIIVEKI